MHFLANNRIKGNSSYIKKIEFIWKNIPRQKYNTDSTLCFSSHYEKSMIYLVAKVKILWLLRVSIIIWKTCILENCYFPLDECNKCYEKCTKYNSFLLKSLYQALKSFLIRYFCRSFCKVLTWYLSYTCYDDTLKAILFADLIANTFYKK